MDGVRNVLLSVSDSLRWVFLPDSIWERGKVSRAIDQLTYYPSSFTTLSTALYPHSTGLTGSTGRYPNMYRKIVIYRESTEVV